MINIISPVIPDQPRSTPAESTRLGGTSGAHFQATIYQTPDGGKGYAVFCPNYRGSTGYGDQLIDELIRHTNNHEVKDVPSGVEALIERGVADPDRIGVVGPRKNSEFCQTSL